MKNESDTQYKDSQDSLTLTVMCVCGCGGYSD